jgi:hypothetical protein
MIQCGSYCKKRFSFISATDNLGLYWLLKELLFAENNSFVEIQICLKDNLAAIKVILYS